MSKLYLAGTLDTKAPEMGYLKSILETGPDRVCLIDLSTTSHGLDADVTAEQVANFHPDGCSAVLGGNDRGKAVTAMGEAFAAYCAKNTSDIAGIIGAGGGGGTAMISAGMRELPYGIPKVMVSTLASGDTAPYVDTSDIIMVPSVTDVAGLNSLSRVILANAANALLGMRQSKPIPADVPKSAVGVTMFGVTTAAVGELTKLIGDTYDLMVFHATGTGGRTMEKLLLENRLAGLIDLTTTEIADLICGGVLSAGPSRLDAVAMTGKPYVGAPGALDMVNFWGPQSVPDQFSDRNLYFHNSNVTLMRTNAEECTRIGRWIGEKLNACSGPVRFLVPLKGFSAIDIEDGPFFDPDADAALIGQLEETLDITKDRQLIKLPMHINDPSFAKVALEQFLSISENRDAIH